MLMNGFLFSRRHPDYLKNESCYRHCAEAYRGGQSFMEKALIRHVSEIDLEFAERKRRAYYFNYPRTIARRITQYALAVPPRRQGADPALLEDWSRSGMRTNEVMRQLSTMLTVYGRVWVQVDAPGFSGKVSRRDAEHGKLRPYVKILSPLEVTDWSYGSDGKLEWALLREELYENSDVTRPGEHIECIKLFRRGSWQLFGKRQGTITELGRGVLPGNEIPLFAVDEPGGFAESSGHWFEDAVRIAEAIFNNESESQMNMVKQMFGLLVVSESFARGALPRNREENANFAATVARSAAVIESVEEKGISRYITPSGVPGTLLRQENEALKRELFDLAGLTLQSQSSEAQTAESKAWDFRNSSQFLASRADLLEQTELRAWELMHLFDNAIPIPKVIYNREFEVKELDRSIASLLQLSELTTGEKFRQSVKKTAVQLLSELSPMDETEKGLLLEEAEKPSNP